MTREINRNMLQDVINRYFFYLFIFSLFFVIILYYLIGFLYTDEICALLLFLLFFYGVLKTPQWEFNKVFLFTLGIFLFYTLYSIGIASNTKRAIFTDLIINMKPYLGFFCVYQLKPFLDDSKKKLLKDISMLVWVVYLLPIGLISIVKEDAMDVTFFHPAYYGIAVTIVSLCYLYCSDFTKREKVIFITMLSVGLLTGKSKFYGFFIVSVFCIVFFENIRYFKLNLKNLLLICSMLAVTVLAAWHKIYIYFYQAIVASGGKEKNMIARYMLYYTFPDILVDYFPFGSGFASYATHSSGEPYSNLYAKYGLDNVWGISKSFHGFISDTYYPSLAQFGVFGIMLFILFWVYIISMSIRLYKKGGYIQSKQIVVILLIIGFLAIESTTGSAYISQGGFFVMMMIGLILSDMQKTGKEKINIQNL